MIHRRKYQSWIINLNHRKKLILKFINMINYFKTIISLPISIFLSGLFLAGTNLASTYFEDIYFEWVNYLLLQLFRIC